MLTPDKVWQKLEIRLGRWRNNLHTRQMALAVGRRSRLKPDTNPVIFFNASTRLFGISLNASFSLLTAWALRLQGIPVIHFVCQAGMSRCVLGTQREDFLKPPPCRACMDQSNRLYTNARVVSFSYQKDENLEAIVEGLSLGQLEKVEYFLQTKGQQDRGNQDSIPLGRLVLASIRWVLRRHTLRDDEPTRYLYRQYILSAAHVAQQFSALLDQAVPQAVILFNGQFFPEAIARWLAVKRNIRTITHEVGLQPLTAFFTTGEATAYPLEIPESFDLTKERDAHLDEYLSKRFQGQFSMAGVKFWPEIKRLDQSFLDMAAGFKQIVPVFTNVIFDTSQPHSNVVFPHMFAWLDQVLEIIRLHPETLFVIRAHPDESRPGKASQESVRQWVDLNHAAELPNLVFIDSTEALSSYELIERSKFVMVYNSTIGLEASIMGAAVLCAGRARYTQLPTVFFPRTVQEFRQEAESLLNEAEIILPGQFKRNARRILYYQLFYSSLPFEDFIEPELMQGFVSLRNFNLEKLIASNSPTIKVISEGILDGKPFLISDTNQSQ